jgi:prephenate dehydrogenase
MSADEHDQAVALVSHTPQIISSLLAARLTRAESAEVALAGQGLRDTTRIAASDPKLWMQILGANASKVATILSEFQTDLSKVITALQNIDSAGSISTLGDALARGNQGVEQIPGKHGAKQQHFAQVIVMIDDRPGQFAKLLNDIAAADINLEDVSLEHAPGAAVGLVQVSVTPAKVRALIASLESLGWRLAG